MSVLTARAAQVMRHAAANPFTRDGRPVCLVTTGWVVRGQRVSAKTVAALINAGMVDGRTFEITAYGFATIGATDPAALDITTARCGDTHTDADGTLVVNHVQWDRDGNTVKVELTADARMVHTHAFCSCPDGNTMADIVRFQVWGERATHGWCCRDCRMVRQFG